MLVSKTTDDQNAHTQNGRRPKCSSAKRQTTKLLVCKMADDQNVVWLWCGCGLVVVLLWCGFGVVVVWLLDMIKNTFFLGSTCKIDKRGSFGAQTSSLPLKRVFEVAPSPFFFNKDKSSKKLGLSCAKLRTSLGKIGSAIFRI